MQKQDFKSEQYVVVESSQELEGHSDHVTCIVTDQNVDNPNNIPILITGSRDKRIIVWTLKVEQSPKGDQLQIVGTPNRALTGHGHFVSDLVLTKTNQFLISSSWDKSIIIWDLQNFKVHKRFNGCDRENLTVCISNDQKAITTSGMEKKIRLWNSLGDCKFETAENNHNDWVSRIRYTPPNSKLSAILSVGWDGALKIWSTDHTHLETIQASTSQINALSISNLAQNIATGGKDNSVKIWDLKNSQDKCKAVFPVNSPVNSLAFNPTSKCLAVGTNQGLKLFSVSFENNQEKNAEKYSTQFRVHEANPAADQKTKRKKKNLEDKIYSVTAVEWSSNGKFLFVGLSNGKIKTFQVKTD